MGKLPDASGTLSSTDPVHKERIELGIRKEQNLISKLGPSGAVPDTKETDRNLSSIDPIAFASKLWLGCDCP